MDASDRRRLRSSLTGAFPWLLESGVGPRAVDAGECDRCGQQPRILPTCGPVAWEAVCRDCGLEVGTELWCDGHQDDARSHLSWAQALPEDWADVVRVWWIATGEVRVDASLSAVESQLPKLGA